MKVKLASIEEAFNVVKRMFFLAYNACGGPMGMGWIQDLRLGGEQPSEEQVWQCVYNAEDYSGGRTFNRKTNEAYGDYVFGRMMKWGCDWDGNVIIIPDRDFKPDYQAFCRTYPNDRALVEAAVKSLGITNAVIEK